MSLRRLCETSYLAERTWCSRMVRRRVGALAKLGPIKGYGFELPRAGQWPKFSFLRLEGRDSTDLLP
ncbi:hypothetical protein NOVOSPHI9U_310061 [Novosphingobium sp. 9U]|nr:hypothetical protein NOVOSPHI9U_310061 [Novosphingobium sp. 9U]